MDARRNRRILFERYHTALKHENEDTRKTQITALGNFRTKTRTKEFLHFFK